MDKLIEKNTDELRIPEEQEAAAPVHFTGKIIVVERLRQIKEAAKYLSAQSVIGFDTETKPTFTAGMRNMHKVALLQLATDECAYLFRLQKIGLPREITALLANKNVVKIGAAILDDIRLLQKLNRFTPNGFVDLQKIITQYGIEDKGVKKMAAKVLGITISKRQQLSNWENAELTDAQMVYAATDAWVCREIYLNLMKREKICFQE